MNKRPPFWGLALLAIALPLWPATDKIEIRHKSRDLQKINQEVLEKKRERDRLKKEAEGISATVNEQQKKAKNLEQSLLYMRQKTISVDQQVASTKNKRDDLLIQLDARENKMLASLETYYVHSLLKGFDHPEAVWDREIVTQQAKNWHDLRSQKDQTNKKLSSLFETQVTLRGELSNQQKTLGTLTSGVQANQRLLTKKMTQQQQIDAELKELRESAEELAKLIDVLRTKIREEEEAEKRARQQKIDLGHVPISRRSLTWPVTGKIIQSFGRQKHPTLGTPFVSNGIVIQSSEQKGVQAVADGKVLYAGEFMSYGPMVVVEHTGDWYTVYAQMTRWAAEKGQIIKKGDTVGVMRRSPMKGYEAYFELRFYGKPTNPLPWLVELK